MKNIKKAFLEPYSAVDLLANKVITRVVSDGQSLRNAIREAIKVGELNQQEVFQILARLQSIGMVHNGDPKNYWAGGYGEDLGPDAINAVPGTNYYASDNNKVVTSSLNKDSELYELFESIENLRDAGVDDEAMIKANPDIKDVLEAMSQHEMVVGARKADMATTAAIDEDPQSSFRALVFEAINATKGTKISFEDAMRQSAEKHGLQPGANLKRIVDLVRQHNPNVPEYKDVEETTVVDKFQAVLKPFAEQAKQKSKSRKISFREAFDDVTKNKFPQADLNKILSWVGLQGMNPDDVVTASYEALVKVAQAAPAAPAPDDADLDAAAKELGGQPDAAAEMPAPDLGDMSADDSVEDPDMAMGGEDAISDDINVEVTPSPSELSELAKDGPEWDVKNMLSLTKAQKYFEALKESLEAVVYNENLKMDLDSVEKYDKVRAMIDGELERIDEAVKGKKKIEGKEQQLEDDVEEASIEDAPVEEMPAPAAPAPAPAPAVKEELEVTE